MMAAISVYRSEFRPSLELAKSYVMLGFNVFGADSLSEAKFRATSMQQAFVNLRSGRPSQLPPPVEGYIERIERYVNKAVREAKLRSSWSNPNEAYENACSTFLRSLLVMMLKLAASLTTLAGSIRRRVTMPSSLREAT